MRKRKVDAEDYIQYLIVSPRTASCRQAAESSPDGTVAHDAYTRLLGRLDANSDELWEEVRGFVKPEKGWFVLDDTTLDKPYARKMELVTNHWSGKHRKVVAGINLITLIWTDGVLSLPIDWRVLQTARDGQTKNDHFRQMLHTARERGLTPRAVLCDSWYSSLENMKLLREFGWPFFLGIKSNRLVARPDEQPCQAGELEGPNAQRVHMPGIGWVGFYRIERIEHTGKRKMCYFVSNDDVLEDGVVRLLREVSWQIEQYHRDLKQECLVERCSARRRKLQLNHIGLSIRAFLRLSLHRFQSGSSITSLCQRLLLDALALYRSSPSFTLDSVDLPNYVEI